VSLFCFHFFVFAVHLSGKSDYPATD